MLNFKRNWFLIFAFCLAILTQQNSFAQEFTASVDETTVSDNERFQVSFTFSGSSINDLSKFSPPSFENFTVLSGPNQSTSIQIINGAQSASLTYSFVIQAKSVGTFSIGSASIEQNGTTYKSDPLKITVIKGTAKPQRKNDNSQISNEEIAKNLFIKTTVDKTRVYKGEQVTVTYKLYTRLSIAAQMSVNKLPQYQGFWAEELETSTNIIFNTQVVDGKQFRVGVLKKAALFPSQTGKLEVTPFELTVPVQVRKNRNRDNFFDDFFNDPFGMGQTIEFNAVSNKVSIDVLPLPERGKPNSFHGAVGDFSLSSDIDKTTAKTNEPVTLKLTISGKGNMELLEVPKLNLPSGFEQYEPKTTDQINKQNVIS
ncbi:MAG: BatD family protein, partial [Ignavibacteriaceae bacterium]|nr:BatD family protein [Ignavibacteriaceae bacterium]